MLIVPRGHELAGKKRPTLRDLARHAFVIPPAGSRWRREAGCPWAGDAGGYRRLIRNGRRDAVAGGGGEEGRVGGARSHVGGVTLLRMRAVEATAAGRIAASPEAIVDFCRRRHIRKLSLFGSVLRDDFTPESDVDVLVEFEPAHVPGFFRFFEMEQELSETLGRKVDLSTPSSLSKYFRARVLAEAFPLHDAA